MVAIKIRAKYGMLTPVHYVGQGKNKARYAIWIFRCDCGNLVEEALSVVHRGRRQSCGCLKYGNKFNLKHGCRNKRVYRIWSQMKIRCSSSKHIAYSRYGGRGIKVCARWQRFENFLADMGEPPSDKHTLDRINNNKGYSPKNCKYSTRKEQNRNARTNILYTIKGQTRCLSEWAELYGVPYLRTWDRVRKSGWNVEQALTEPCHIEKARTFKTILDGK